MVFKMEISRNWKVGTQNYKLSGQGETFDEAAQQLAKVGSLYDMPKCGLCDSDWLRLTSYITKDGNNYHYNKLQCGKCRGSLNISEAKADSSRYYKKNDDNKPDWQEYKGKEDNKEVKPARSVKGEDVEW